MSVKNPMVEVTVAKLATPVKPSSEKNIVAKMIVNKPTIARPSKPVVIMPQIPVIIRSDKPVLIKVSDPTIMIPMMGRGGFKRHFITKRFLMWLIILVILFLIIYLYKDTLKSMIKVV